MPTCRRELAEFDRTMETRACGVHFALVSAKVFSVLRPGVCTLGNGTLVWPRVGFAVETVDKIRSALELRWYIARRGKELTLNRIVV